MHSRLELNHSRDGSFAETLKRFPKTRPALPPQFEAIYLKAFITNRSGSSAATGLSKKMESWMHRKVAGDIRHYGSQSTLEIGAGTLNHLPYETHTTPYDIVEPLRCLYEGSRDVRRIRRVYDDIRDIRPTTRYDRIISIATFEHICDLPQVIATCGRLLSMRGHLRIAVPSEGTMLWSLGWHLTTGIEFRLRHKLNYAVMMRHEHVNTAIEIEQVLSYFFTKVESAVFGLSRSVSLYQFFDCSRPNVERCRLFEI